MVMAQDTDVPGMTEGQNLKLKTIEAYVTGKVQGVGFRACVRKIASHLSVTGEVMNLEDGRVCIRATGEDIIIDKFLSSLRECPRAYIRDIDICEKEPVEYEDFEIVRVY
jgi:acylphosphatase